MPRGCCVDRHPAMPLLLSAASPIGLQSDHQLLAATLRHAGAGPVQFQINGPFYQNNSMEKYVSGAYLHDPYSSQRTGVPLNQACCSGLWSWRANLEPYVSHMFKQ